MKFQLPFLLVFIFFSFGRQPYDEELGIELYRYSQAVFCSDEVILNWSCDLPCQKTRGMQDLQVISSQLLDTKSFIGYQAVSNKIVIVFRGSVSSINWKIDFTFAKKSHFCDQCKVHFGFMAGWLSLKHDIISALKILQSAHPTAQLYVTGHSLGAALASLAALDLQLSGYQVSGLYSFGCPRLGNRALSRLFESTLSNAYRVVHNKDLVPQLPPRIIGYHHYSQEIWYNQDSTSYEICSEENSEDPHCQNSIRYSQLTRNDHTHYYGMQTSCDGY